MFNETHHNVFVSAKMDRILAQNKIEQVNKEIRSEVEQNKMLEYFKRKLISNAKISERPVFLLYLDLSRKNCLIYD